MAKQSKAKSETEREATAPQKFAEVPPPYAQAVGATYLVETMMQIQQSIGELKSNVKHLNDTVDKQSDKLDHISHVIYAASAVTVVVVAVAGFLLVQMWDGLIMMMTTPK